jgi:hypothetical protein
MRLAHDWEAIGLLAPKRHSGEDTSIKAEESTISLLFVFCRLPLWAKVHSLLFYVTCWALH